MDILSRKYRAIGPLLTKMEGLVAHTNTGRSPKLQPYYAYWENAVYQALTKVCILTFNVLYFVIYCWNSSDLLAANLL